MSQLAIQKVFKGNGLVQTIFRTSATNLLVIMIGTLISIVTARMFGVVGKGEFSAIQFWPTLLVGLVGFGLPTSLIYNLKQHRGDAGEFIRAGFLFQIPVSIIVGVVAWIWIPTWLGNYPEGIVKIAQWYTVLTIPIVLALNLISALAQSKGDFKTYNGVKLFAPLCNLVGLMILWVSGSLSIYSASINSLVTNILIITWSLYNVKDILPIHWFKGLRNKLLYKYLFGYGSKVFGVELLGTLYNQFDKIVIISMLSARDLGFYTVVYALSRVFNSVQMAIANVLFPTVTGMEKDKITATVGKAFRLSMMLMVIILIPSLFIGRFLMGLLFGTMFLEASDTFYILSIECIIGGGSWILASSFNALGRPGLILIRQIIALSITVGLLFVLTPLYGLNGIAYALLIGAVIRLAVTMASMRIVFHVQLREMLFNRNDFQFLIVKMKEKIQSKGEG